MSWLYLHFVCANIFPVVKAVVVLALTSLVLVIVGSNCNWWAVVELHNIGDILDPLHLSHDDVCPIKQSREYVLGTYTYPDGSGDHGFARHSE